MIDAPPPARPLVNQFRRMREEEERLAKENPHMAAALTEEKREGHRLAVIARTIALLIVAIVLPIVNFHPSVLVYELVLIVLIGMGWLQLRVASVGYSRMELFLLYADLVIITLAITVPNPWMIEPVPSAYSFEFNTFIYFFIFLALSTLAYSWRTVWAMGTQVAVIWLVAIILIYAFGRQVPHLTSAITEAIPMFPFLASELDPNSVRANLRFQEIVVFLLVAAILAVKGWRSNQLLIRQALVAEERANLSRYFPASMVDSLASTKHDIGAVRSQEVAVLFTDIVGFTKIAETETPERVMGLLRAYHQVVEKALFENGGTLDKYLGDGVMATFGTPEPGEHDAINAVNAAKQILRDAQKVSADRHSKGEPPFKVSVGLHYGPVVMGDIGPDRRLEFAVVGDTVNVASRLEAATRELKCSIALSDDLIRKVNDPANDDIAPEDLRLRKGVKLKGRSSPVDIWTDA